MLFRRSESGKRISAEWHKMREVARTTSNSVDEWSDSDIEKYDLETAGITGEDNRINFIVNRPIPSEAGIENGTDIRTLEDR